MSTCVVQDGDVANTCLDQRGFTYKHAAVFRSIWDTVLSIAIHAYHDVLLLHFPVQYAAQYSARVEAVLSRFEHDEEDSDAKTHWELLRDELARWYGFFFFAVLIIIL